MNIEEMMQERLADEGDFRVFPITWGVMESKSVNKETGVKSQSVAITIQFGIRQKWMGVESGWSPEWPIGYHAEGRFWVIKADGTLNDSAIENLGKCGLWDGDFDKLKDPVPSGFYLLATVDGESFGDKEYFRVNWITPDADKPKARGGYAPVDGGLLASLRGKFQGSAKAIASGARNSGAPAAATPTPTPATPSPVVASPSTATTPSPVPAPGGAPAPSPTPGGEPAPASDPFEGEDGGVPPF